MLDLSMLLIQQTGQDKPNFTYFSLVILVFIEELLKKIDDLTSQISYRTQIIS